MRYRRNKISSRNFTRGGIKMNAEEKEKFKELQENSKGLIQSRQFPGLKRLLSQFYPDKNHFIYELLQNAEDAGASSVRFEVLKEKLIFAHNGKEPFSIKHIDAITNISLSTKLDEDSKAGKFGIGFKSVFAFTETPYIYTDDICFKITDMFLPEEVPQRSTSGETIFEFPFNGKMPANIALEKIEAGLKDINATTLLFLTNIKEIVYTLSNEKTGIIEAKHNVKSKKTDAIGEYVFAEFIHCSSVFDDGKLDEDTDWLRFNRRITIKTEEDITKEYKEHWVNIAFPVVKRDHSQEEYAFSALSKDSSQNGPQGKVSILFIAPNAKSNLQFHINAPFGCPPSRDSVSDTPENDKLVDEVAVLVREAIEDLRDLGELKPDFFNFLPLENDCVDKQFAPIQNAILDVFETEKVYPLMEGGYSHKKNVISAGEELRKLFSIADVRTILNDSSLEYLQNPQTRGYTFIKENGVLILDAPTILNGLLRLDCNTVNTLFMDQDPKWYKGIYTLLSSERDNFDLTPLSRCNIVYSKNGRLLIPDEARFIDDDAVILDKQFEEVNKTVYDQSESGKSKARLFLEAIGVKVFSQNDAKAIKETRRQEKLQNRIDSLTANDDIISITKEIIKYVRSTSGKDYPLDLSGAWILSETRKLVKPSDCYLDAPYCDTGFSKAEQLHHKEGVSKLYEKELTDKELEAFLETLKANGVLYCLEIKRLTSIAADNPHKKRLNTRPGRIQRETCCQKGDWTIDHLQDYISMKERAISFLIWKAIMKERPQPWYWYYCVEKDKTKAYRRWQQNEYTEDESQLVYYLCVSEWIPDIHGEFKRPSALTADTIDADFAIDDESPFLKAIAFGKEYEELQQRLLQEERERSADSQKKDQAAKDLGYPSYADLEAVLEKARKFDKAEAEGRILPEEHIDEPFAKSNNPDRRLEIVTNEIAASPERQYETKERSVRTTKASEEAKTMLKQLYTNSDEIMICQCCGKELPFKKKDGEYYFEAVGLDKRGGTFFKKETPYAYIACCPNCAAMFREHIINAASDQKGIASIIYMIKEKISDKKPNGNEIIKFVMDNKEFGLIFVQKHIIDIRAALQAESK